MPKKTDVRIVRVTELDKKRGTPGSPSDCAMARAIKRAFPEWSHIAVGHQTIRATDRALGVRYQLATPLINSKAQREYDATHDADFRDFHLSKTEALVEPMEFDAHRREMQQARREAQRRGERAVTPYTDAQKAANRQRRRAG